MSNFQPQQKILNFLDEFIESESFQNKVHHFRKDIGVPHDGLKISDQTLKEYLGCKMRGITTPPGLKKGQFKISKISECIKDFPIKNIEADFAFGIYVLYNIYKRDLFEKALFIENMCKFVQVRDEMEEYCADIPEMNHMYLNHQINLTKDYPVALYIHPNATQRDVIEYVKTIWPVFQLYVKEYKNKTALGKYKKKNSLVRERNKFIWENRNLPRKEIMRQLSDKYGWDKRDQFIDYAYIGKIISLEKNKRKEL